MKYIRILFWFTKPTLRVTDRGPDDDLLTIPNRNKKPQPPKQVKQVTLLTYPVM